MLTMQYLYWISGVVSLVTAFAIGWLILSPRIHEGALIKLGLITIVFGLLASVAHTFDGTDGWYAIWASSLAIRFGILLVVLGLLWRRKRCGSWRGATDWGELR